MHTHAHVCLCLPLNYSSDGHAPTQLVPWSTTCQQAVTHHRPFVYLPQGWPIYGPCP